MTGGELIREARLLAGLSQSELAARIGRDRAQVARWEIGGSEPNLETVVAVIQTCGYDLPLQLVPLEHTASRALDQNAELTPERRLEQVLERDKLPDPRDVLTVLRDHFVSFVLVGSLAHVIHGADESPRSVEITPSTRQENLDRLEAALAELRDAGRVKADELRVVPEPEGTRGYEDLRRRARREPIGRGLRPDVASVADCARMLAALGREEDLSRVRDLRRLMELERGRSRSIGRER